MARPSSHNGVSKKVVPLALGECCNRLLDELAWSTRQSKANVVRTLIEQAKVEDFKKSDRD
jgi:hypothetical protein